MGWAAMPKTPINKDRHACRSEDEIRDSTRLDEDWDVDPIPQSTCVQLTAQSQLGARVLLPNALHPVKRVNR